MKLTTKIIISFLITGVILSGMISKLYRYDLPLLWVISISIILAGVIGILVARIIIIPIDRLFQGTEIIKAGNLDYRVGTEKQDEVGRLSKTMDDFVEELSTATQSIADLQELNAELKDQAEEFHANEDYFRRLFEYSNDAVFIYDFEGNALDVNKKACDMLGYSKDELLKIQFLDLQTKGELTRSKSASKLNNETGSVRFESVFQRKDGSIIDVEISSSVVDLKKSIMQSIVGNITARKQMESSLRESEEKFRTFMETASDLMFITGPDGTFAYVNTAMANHLGYAKDELIGMSIQDLYAKDTVEASKMIRQSFSAEGEDIHQLIWETKNRRRIYGEMKVVGNYNSEGQFKGIRGIFRDISERRKIENSQRLAQMGKMAADMAHEVKNQLMVINTRAQIAEMRKPEDPEVVSDLTVIRGQCGRVNDIVKRLLMFSKPSKGDFVLADVNETVDSVIKLVEKQYSLNSVEIRKDLATELPEVLMDAKQIQDVFLNLIGNSYEAMSGGGEVIVRTASTRGSVQVLIADTGSGISESDLEHIFDPFFTTKEEGTGLGLSVCYGVIQAHDGELRYTSELGKGTTATVSFPIPNSG